MTGIKHEKKTRFFAARTFLGHTDANHFRHAAYLAAVFAAVMGLEGGRAAAGARGARINWALSEFLCGALGRPLGEGTT